MRKCEGRSDLTSLLTPIQGNPNFPPGLLDDIWALMGINKMYDLFEGSTLVSIEQIQKKYNLPKHHFFRYLQVWDFVTKKTPLSILIA